MSHIVGRNAELRLVENACYQALQSGLQIVVLTGPAGVGKTALLEEVERQMQTWRTVSALGDEAESLVQMGVLDQVLRAIDPLRRGSTSVAQSDPAAAGAALLEALTPHLASAGVLLMFDDVQWMDTSSMQAIAFALKRLRYDPLVALFAMREGEEPHLSTSLARVIASVPTTRRRLEGLGLDGTLQLLGGLGYSRVTRSAGERLRAHTDGNPLYIRALLDELGNAALASRFAWSLPAPAAYAASVHSRIAGCDAATRTIIESASVLGMAPTLSSLAAMTGSDPTRGVDELIQLHLMEMVHGGTKQIRFAHPLVRSSVYHQLPLAKRGALHRKAAAIAGDHLTRLRHLVNATAMPDGELFQELLDAGRLEAQAGRWTMCAEIFESAAEIAPREIEARRLAIDAIDCMLAAGEAAEAAARWTSLTPASAGSPAYAYIEGRLEFVQGRTREAFRLLNRAYRDARPNDTSIAARAASALAQARLDDGRAVAAVEWADRAIALRTSETLMPIDPRLTKLMALGLRSKKDEVLAMVDQPPSGFDGMTPEDLLGRGAMSLWSGDSERAHADLALASHAQNISMELRVLSLLYLSDTEYRLGRWDDAITHAELAASLADDAEMGWLSAIVHSTACFPLAGRGAWDDARRHAAAAAAAASAHVASEVWSGMAAARLAHARADWHGVADALEPLTGSARLDGVANYGVQPWHPLLVEALAMVGRTADARRVMHVFEEATRRPGFMPAGVMAARARASIAQAAGEHDEAQRILEDGLANVAGCDALPEIALAMFALGGLYRRQGKRAAARAQLAAARARFVSLGATPYIERCDLEMAALGLSPARRQTSERDRLTPREVSVANLAALGMTNKEIASELVISVKTVEFHLSNVFGKLGVSSRARLARSWPADEDTSEVPGRIRLGSGALSPHP